ncbi:MAG: hypothetical protein AAFP19_11250 [Bacteroidota bacterium]
MKLSMFNVLALAALILLSSCGKNKDTSPTMTDDELIQAIQEATNKSSVDMEELPIATVTNLEENFTESNMERALLAPELGYELDMRRKEGTRIGEKSQAYFDLDGRALRAKKEGDKEKDKDGYDRKECFELIYPVTFILPDGSTITADDEKAAHEAIKAWYDANPAADERPYLQYPVSIAWGDEAFTVNSGEELEAWKKRCEDKEDEDEEEGICFELVYPISYTMPDGSTISGSEEELDRAIKAWYDANPATDQRPLLQYPIEVIIGDELITINNEEELEELKRRCEDKWDEDKECFELLYPISYTMPDGSVISGNTEEEVGSAIEAWYDNNPATDQRPMMQYPVEVIIGDEIISIGSEEEMDELKRRCEEDGEEYDCQEINANIGDPCRSDDGTVGTVNANCECE